MRVISSDGGWEVRNGWSLDESDTSQTAQPKKRNSRRGDGLSEAVEWYKDNTNFNRPGWRRLWADVLPPGG